MMDAIILFAKTLQFRIQDVLPVLSALLSTSIWNKFCNLLPVNLILLWNCFNGISKIVILLFRPNSFLWWRINCFRDRRNTVFFLLNLLWLILLVFRGSSLVVFESFIVRKSIQREWRSIRYAWRRIAFRKRWATRIGQHAIGGMNNNGWNVAAVAHWRLIHLWVLQRRRGFLYNGQAVLGRGDRAIIRNYHSQPKQNDTSTIVIDWRHTVVAIVGHLHNNKKRLDGHEEMNNPNTCQANSASSVVRYYDKQTEHAPTAINQNS